jgi:phosphoribosylamine---glycine ligase
LVIDTEALCLDLVLRFINAGHDCRWYRYSKKPIKDGDGFRLNIIDDWRASMGWARDGLIIVTGNSIYMQELDRFRELGFKIFGPTAASAELETNRGVGMKVFQDAGIEVPPYHEFNGMAEAERFAMKSDQCYVFKVLDGSAADKSLTYVSCDPADMVGWLRRNMKAGANIKKCMLQEKIDADFEIGINGWFGPDGFLPEKYQISFEHKKLCNEEIGPNTGEMCSVSQYVETDKLVADLLTPLVGTLRKTGHRGDFCVGAIIDKQGKAWPLEATSRLGYPSLFAQLASHKGDPAQWMKDLLGGEDTLKVSYDVCSAVVIGQPWFPYEKSPADLVEGNPIGGITDEIMDNLHFCGVMKAKGPIMKDGKIVEANTYQTTAEYVMVVTALGKTIARSRDKAYRVVEQIKIPNAIYRTDCGKKVEKNLSAMRQHGYALELEA